MADSDQELHERIGVASIGLFPRYFLHIGTSPLFSQPHVRVAMGDVANRIGG